LRGVGAELDGDLVGGPSEVGEQVTNLLFAGVDDLTGGSLVDGGSDFPAQLLEALAELLLESVCREGRFRRHGLLLSQVTRVPGSPGSARSLRAPGRFATPERRG
jgi:hypothetical protein